MKKLYQCLPAVVLFFSMLYCTGAIAQEGSLEMKVVRGKIIDKKDKQPIQHVSVAETDRDGRTVRGVTTDIE